MLIQMDARGIFSTIFRQIWKFLGVFVPVVMLALLYILFSGSAYQSTAKLLVRFGQEARPDMSISGNAGGTSAEERKGLVQSNVNILTSRDLAESLLREVTLEKAYPDMAWRRGDEAKKISAAAIRLVQNDLVTRTESGAGIIEVSLFNRDPEVAGLMLDGLLKLFIKKQAEVYGNPQAEAIRDQAEAAYKKLEEANKELFNYKAQVGVSSIDEEITLLLRKRSDIAEYLSRNGNVKGADSGEKLDLEKIAERPIVPLFEGEVPSDVAAAAGPGLSGAPSPISDEPPGPPLSARSIMDGDGIIPAKKGENGSDAPFPALDEIQKRIDEMRAKEITMRQTYRPDSEIMRKLRDNITAETEVLNQSVMALRDKLKELDERIVKMNEYKSVYDTLARKVQYNEESYGIAKERLQAAEVNSDLNQRQITQISVLEQPVVSNGPAKPRKLMILLLASLVGAAFGAALCLASELLDQRIYTPEQIYPVLRQPLLSSFSLKVAGPGGTLVTPTYIEQSLVRFYKSLPPELIERFPALKKFAPPESVAISGPILSPRSMATLYQSMMARMRDLTERKVVFLTSSYRGEGAPTIAWEFSRYVAEVLGQRVLYIEAVGQEGRPTLLEVARGQASIGQAVVRIAGIEGELQVASLSGPGQSNLLLANLDAISAQIMTLKDVFDLVIISAADILNDPVYVGIGRIAHGTVFVVEADRTRQPASLRALEVLRNTGANVLGAVLNKRIYYIPKWMYQRL